MLLYHPCFDCHHAAFRILQLLYQSNQTVFDIETIRILDFYLLFPSELVKLKFPQTLLAHKKDIKSLRNKYSDLENPNRVFQQLSPFQTGAIYALAAHGLVDIRPLHETKEVRRTNKAIPEEVLAAFQEKDAVHHKLVYFLANELATIPLRGPNGLKDRSSLLDHRYDII